MTFSSDVLSLEVDDGVATLWLDRADRRNALGRAFWEDLPRATAAVAGDRSIRALILAARGEHFTVGLDLKEMTLVGPEYQVGERSRAAVSERGYRAVRQMQATITSLAELEVPVVAAVQGYCLGGGLDLICACDVRVASAEAIFSVREIKMAIVADLGTLQRLPRIVGVGAASEMALTGDDIGAERAVAMGLINRVVADPAAVYPAAVDIARRIAANSPLAVRGTKAVLRANDGRTVDEGLDFVARWNVMYLDSHDLREAYAAFMEKRPPVFTGQ